MFDATERLLQTVSLQDLTVAQILREAGLSRANFYHYFANKYDVLVALLSRVFDESYGDGAPWASSPGRARARQMGASLESTLAMWTDHGAVICAVIEHMHTEPAVAQAWQRMYAQFVDTVTEQIIYERESGAAPSGPPAELIAAMLVGAAERVFYVSTRGLDDRLPTTDSVIESLRAVNEAAIYGGRTSTDAGSEAAVRRTVTTEAAPVVTHERDSVDSDTARAILAAMRELLAETPLADVSVAKVLERAGVSRASFYFYFRSKEDAFVVLFREAADEIVRGLSGIADIDRSDPEAVRAQVGDWLNLEGFTGSVIGNAVHAWPQLAELRVEYLAAMRAMEAVLESVITADRESGLAPAGPAPAEYAATVLWAVERVVAGTLAGESHVQDLDSVTSMVGGFLQAALYGRR